MRSDLQYVLAPAQPPQDHGVRQVVELPRMPQLDDIPRVASSASPWPYVSAMEPPRPRTPPPTTGLHSPPTSAPHQRSAWTAVNDLHHSGHQGHPSHQSHQSHPTRSHLDAAVPSEPLPSANSSAQGAQEHHRPDDTINRGLPFHAPSLHQTGTSQSAAHPPQPRSYQPSEPARPSSPKRPRLESFNRAPSHQARPDAPAEKQHSRGHSINSLVNHELVTPPPNETRPDPAFGVIRPSGDYSPYKTTNLPSQTAEALPRTRVPGQQVRFATVSNPSTMGPPPSVEPGVRPVGVDRPPQTPPLANRQEESVPEAPSSSADAGELFNAFMKCARCDPIRRRFMDDRMGAGLKHHGEYGPLGKSIQDLERIMKDLHCPDCNPTGTQHLVPSLNGFHGGHDDRPRNNVPPKRKSPSSDADEEESPNKLRRVTPDSAASSIHRSADAMSPTAHTSSEREPEPEPSEDLIAYEDINEAVTIINDKERTPNAIPVGNLFNRTLESLHMRPRRQTDGQRG